MCMVFWDNSHSPSRRMNAVFAKTRMDRLIESMPGGETAFEASFFDFSEDSSGDFPGAIHIPWPAGTYQRAAKLNRIAVHLYDTDEIPDVVGFMDSDLFIKDGGIEAFHRRMSSMRPNSMLVFDMFQILDPSFVDYSNAKLVEGAMVKHRRIEGLGGLSFVDFRRFSEIGGYDERFTVWGMEDDDVYRRLLRNGVKYTHASDDFVLHLPHDTMNLRDPAIKPVFKTKTHVEAFEAQKRYLAESSVVRPSTLLERFYHAKL